MNVESVLASTLGALSLLGLTIVVRMLTSISKAVNDQNVMLTDVSSTLHGVVKRVDALDKWKDAQQEQQVTDLRAQVADLKREQHEP